MMVERKRRKCTLRREEIVGFECLFVFFRLNSDCRSRGMILKTPFFLSEVFSLFLTLLGEISPASAQYSSIQDIIGLMFRF